MTIRTAFSFILLFIFLSPISLLAQNNDDAFGEVIDVELVNVEVWVTDRKDRPIVGLTASDFEVREDGKPVEIGYFAEVTSRKPVTARPQQLAEPDASDSFSSLPQAEAGDPGFLVFYFDDLHLRSNGRKGLIADLRRFLQSQAVPAERVMLTRQDEDLRIMVPFGSSQTQIEEALEALEPNPQISAQIEREASLALGRLQQLWEQIRQTVQIGDPCETFVRQASNEVDRYSRETRTHNALTLRHLHDTASFLAGVPGVKTLIYLSDALETLPGQGLLSYIESLCPTTQQGGRMSLQSESLAEPLRRLTRHANANRVTIYAMQPSGLRYGAIGVAEQQSFDIRGSKAFDSEMRLSERNGLSILAAETGGRAIFNKNRLVGELREIGHEMSSYYSLAYRPPHGGDGREHSIDVNVSGFRVRHRQGYRDKNPSERMAERLETTLYLGLMSNPLEVRLGAGDVRPGEKGTFVLPLHVVVPKERVTFLPVEEGEKSRLQIQVSARNTRNRRTVAEQKIFELDKASLDASERIALVVELPISVGVHVVAVGIRDEATQETSYVSTTLEIQPPESDG